MSAEGFTLFDTGIGRCGVAWGGRGIVGVQLPEARDTDTHARLLRRFPGAREAAPPPAVERAVEDMTALLRGEARDLGPELARGGNAEVREQRVAVSPALEEDEPEAVVDVGGDAVLEATRLGARPGDVLKAQAAELVEGVEARVDGAGDDDHSSSLVACCRTIGRRRERAITNGSTGDAAAARKETHRAATSG